MSDPSNTCTGGSFVITPENMVGLSRGVGVIESVPSQSRAGSNKSSRRSSQTGLDHLVWMGPFCTLVTLLYYALVTFCTFSNEARVPSSLIRILCSGSSNFLKIYYLMEKVAVPQIIRNIYRASVSPSSETRFMQILERPFLILAFPIAIKVCWSWSCNSCRLRVFTRFLRQFVWLPDICRYASTSPKAQWNHPLRAPAKVCFHTPSQKFVTRKQPSALSETHHSQIFTNDHAVSLVPQLHRSAHDVAISVFPQLWISNER